MAPSEYIITAAVAPEQLIQVGPLISGAWARPGDELGREIRGAFLLDTGSYGAMIDLEAAELLNLPLRGSRELHGIHGYGRLQEYRAQVFLRARDAAGQSATFAPFVDCVGVPSLRQRNQKHGVDLIGILGRLFLQHGCLEIDAASGTVRLTLQAPAIGGEKANDI